MQPRHDECELGTDTILCDQRMQLKTEGGKYDVAARGRDEFAHIVIYFEDDALALDLARVWTRKS